MYLLFVMCTRTLPSSLQETRVHFGHKIHPFFNYQNESQNITVDRFYMEVYKSHDMAVMTCFYNEFYI
jgi:hypothetical protein